MKNNRCNSLLRHPWGTLLLGIASIFLIGCGKQDEINTVQQFVQIESSFYYLENNDLYEKTEMSAEWKLIATDVKQIITEFDIVNVLLTSGEIRCLRGEIDEYSSHTDKIRDAILYSEENRFELVADYFAHCNLLGVLSTGELCYFDGYGYETVMPDVEAEIIKASGNYFLTETGTLYEISVSNEGELLGPNIVEEDCIDFEYYYGNGSLITLSKTNGIRVDTHYTQYGKPDFAGWDNNASEIFASHCLFAVAYRDVTIKYQTYKNENGWQTGKIKRKYKQIKGMVISQYTIQICVLTEDYQVILLDPQ